jgi:hypothetical protein
MKNPPPTRSRRAVLDETGHMHITDALIDLSHYTFEA